MDLLRVLNDVVDGKVHRLPNGVFMVAEDAQVEQDERATYIDMLRLLIRKSWVMESNRSHGRDRDGIGKRLRLTTVGEIRRLELNTARAGAAS